jgi:hypothetical protein
MRLFVLTGVAALLATAASAETIYVAPNGSDDYEAAQGLDGHSVEKTLHRALNSAAELLNGGATEVSVHVAEGEYDGKAGMGIWEIPSINNPQGVLRIVGGWHDGFAERAPFDYWSALKTSETRNGAFISLGRRSALAEFTISGFIFDGSPSNGYDAETNSLIRSRTRTWPMLSFGYVKTDLLVIADNVFANAGHGVFDPAITPASDDAVVEIRNNLFLNNIKAIQVGAGINPVREVRVIGNTFLMNWPYNPDTTSSNVGALTLDERSSAQSIVIEGNIFAQNPGGAMQHDWPEDRMPELAIRSNVFYQNALLFGNDEPGAGVLVGKFGTNPRYLILDLETVEEDFGYNVEGNAYADPEFDVEFELEVTPDGDDVELMGFAPKMDLRFVPLPAAMNIEGYGAHPDRTIQF